MADNDTVKLDDENISLAELAGLSMDDVAEKRGESLPKGHYVFEVQGGDDTPKLAKIGEGDKAKAGVRFVCKVIDVIDVNDPEFKEAPDSLIGKVHFETMFLSSVDSLGYLKAFVKDIGAPYSSKLSDLLAGCALVRFQAPIGKRKNPNDTDQVFTNIVRGKHLKPIAAAESSEVAKAVA